MNTFGLIPEQYNAIKSIILNEPSVEKALVFGSRALDTYSDNSDIDIALIGTEVSVDTLLNIMTKCDSADVFYKIDLVNYNTIESKPLKAHIDTYGKDLY